MRLVDRAKDLVKQAVDIARGSGPSNSKTRTTTLDMVAESIALAKFPTAQSRIETANLYEDYLAADQLRHTSMVMGASGVKWASLPKVAFPFVDTVLSEFAKTYTEKPHRYFDSAKPSRATSGASKPSAFDLALERWHDLAEQDESDYTPSLLMADKRTYLHGRGVMRIWPAYPIDSKQHKKQLNYPRLDFFHPGQFEVLCDQRWPARPMAFILYLSPIAEDGSVDRAQVWTDEVTIDIVDGKPEPALPNKLGLMPFVGFANYIDTQEYWRAGLGRKLCYANALFDVGWTHLFAMLVEQSHGQPVATDADQKWLKSPQWGWDKVISLEKGGAFTYAATQARFESAVAVLDKFIERVYWTCLLPINKFRENTSGVESGVAYKLKNADVLEARKARAGILYPREKAMWRMALLVGAAFGLPDNAGETPPKSMLIDYAAPEIPVPTTEALAQRDSDIKLGLISVVDEYRKANPGVENDEQALEELRANAEFNAEFIGGQTPPTLKDEVAKLKAQAAAGAVGGQGAPPAPLVGRDGKPLKGAAAAAAGQGGA